MPPKATNKPKPTGKKDLSPRPPLVSRPSGSPSPTLSDRIEKDKSTWQSWSVGQIVRIPLQNNPDHLTIHAPPEQPRSPVSKASETTVTSAPRVQGTIRAPSNLAIIAAVYASRMVVLPINNDLPEDFDAEEADSHSTYHDPPNPVTLDVIDRDPNTNIYYPPDSVAADQATGPLGNFLGAESVEHDPGSLHIQIGDYVNMTDVVSVQYGGYIERVGKLLHSSIDLLNRRYAFIHGPVARLPPDEQEDVLAAHVRGEQTGYEPNPQPGTVYALQTLYKPPQSAVSKAQKAQTAAVMANAAKPDVVDVSSGDEQDDDDEPEIPNSDSDSDSDPDNGDQPPAAVKKPPTKSQSKPSAKPKPNTAAAAATSSSTQKISRQRVNGRWDCGHTGICAPGGKKCKHACCKNGAAAAPKGWRRINNKGVEIKALSDAHVAKKTSTTAAAATPAPAPAAAKKTAATKPKMMAAAKTANEDEEEETESETESESEDEDGNNGDKNNKKKKDTATARVNKTRDNGKGTTGKKRKSPETEEEEESSEEEEDARAKKGKGKAKQKKTGKTPVLPPRKKAKRA